MSSKLALNFSSEVVDNHTHTHPMSLADLLRTENAHQPDLKNWSVRYDGDWNDYFQVPGASMQ